MGSPSTHAPFAQVSPKREDVTKFVQLGGLVETLIGDPVTTAGNHRCMLPDGGRAPSGHGSIPFDHQGAPCADGRHHRHWSGTEG